jgi:hypothetical protein
MIKSNSNKGFQLTFTNGYTISVQFGFGSYSSNKNDKVMPTGNYSSQNAEVGYWNDSVNEGEIEIEAFCDANKVAELINKVSNL